MRNDAEPREDVDDMLEDIENLKKAMMVALPEEAFEEIVDNFDEVERIDPRTEGQKLCQYRPRLHGSCR